MATKGKIGNAGRQAKIAAGLFWADYGYLGATVEELEKGGADWIHIEMRDGKYMDFAAPRGGIDILDGIRPRTSLEIEVQLQMIVNILLGRHQAVLTFHMDRSKHFLLGSICTRLGHKHGDYGERSHRGSATEISLNWWPFW